MEAFFHIDHAPISALTKGHKLDCQKTYHLGLNQIPLVLCVAFATTQCPYCVVVLVDWPFF